MVVRSCQKEKIATREKKTTSWLTWAPTVLTLPIILGRPSLCFIAGLSDFFAHSGELKSLKVALQWEGMGQGKPEKEKKG